MNGGDIGMALLAVVGITILLPWLLGLRSFIRRRKPPPRFEHVRCHQDGWELDQGHNSWERKK